MESQGKRSRIRWWVWVLGAAAAVLAGVLAAMVFMDEEVYRRQLDERISARLQREVRFAGPLSLRPSLWPTFIVEDVRVANPAWASRPYLLRARRLQVQVALLPLLRNRLRIEEIEIVGADIRLERGPDGADNWSFATTGNGGRHTDLGGVTVRDSRLEFRAARPLVLHIDDARLDAAAARPLGLEARGRFNGQDFGFRLDAGALQALGRPAPWPLRARLQAAGTELALRGTAAGPSAERVWELDLELEGGHWGRFLAFLGFTGGSGAAFEAGGTLKLAVDRVQVPAFSARVGGSRLRGALEWRRAGGRPRFTARLDSPNLDGADLAGPPAAPFSAGALPELPLPLELLRAADGELELKLQRLRHAGLDVDALKLEATLKDGRLRVTPLTARVAGGRLRGEAGLDAAARTPVLSIEARAEDMDLARLVRGFAPGAPVAGTARSLSLRARSRGPEWVRRARFRLSGAGRLQIEQVAAMEIDRAVLRADPGAAVRLKVLGKVRDQSVELEGRGGTLAALWQAPRSWPLQFSAAAGRTRLNARRLPAPPDGAAGPVFGFTLRGARLNELETWSFAGLPPWGPYSLAGRYENDGPRHRFRSLQGRLGTGSIAAGELVLSTGDRLHLGLRLKAETIDLADFMAGGRTQAPPAGTASSRRIPEWEFPVEDLRRFDMDLQVAVDHLRAEGGDLGRLGFRLALDRGRLLLSPFEGALSGARVKGELSFDAAARPPATELSLELEDLDYGALMDHLGVTDQVRGSASIELRLAGRGADLRQALAVSRGRLSVVGGKGRIANRYLDLWGGGLFGAILPAGLRGKEYTTVNCVVARFDIDQGVAASDAMLLDTRQTTVAGSGIVDLGKESVDLVFKPAPKDPGLNVFSQPMGVKGTFADLKVAPTTLGTAWFLGKLMVGLANPAYLVVIFGDVGTGRTNPCLAAVEKQAQVKQSKIRKPGVIERLRGWFRDVQNLPEKVLEE